MVEFAFWVKGIKKLKWQFSRDSVHNYMDGFDLVLDSCESGA